MTKPWLLTISSGLGPVEVRHFVRLLADALLQELPGRGVQIESVVAHGSDDAPHSIDLAFEAHRHVFEDLIGTHVLLHASPRRGKRSRKRWYAAVSVSERSEVEVAAIDARDVVFEACRASGAGGQHVNKTESAVRARHVPTGLEVRIESERSQHRNKQRALEVLASMLAVRRDARVAHVASDRRHRALQVERGREVASWRLAAGTLTRNDTTYALEP